MKLRKQVLLPLIVLILIAESAFPVSVGVRSSKDYAFTMRVLREIKPMIENFRTDESYKVYQNLQAGFEDATKDYFSNNFDSSYRKFYNLKLEMMKFLEDLSKSYLERTEKILKASIDDNKAIQVFVEYNKHSGYAAYFRKPFNPLIDVKPYNDEFSAQDFHFFYDAPKIEDYLHSGYFYHGEANRIYNGSDIEFIKSRKKMKTENIDFVIERYLSVIGLCRKSKQCALEMYKNKNDYTTGGILDKYKIRKSQITPIFDDRIPEEYKVDAVDNVKLFYSIEVERRKKALAQ